MSRSAIQSLPSLDVSAKPIKVFHAITDVEMQFDATVSAEYAVAFAYCEENNRLSELYAHRDDARLPAMYAKLPMMRGKQSVGCGDWMAACPLH
jgi:hypothetical protein